MYAFADPAPLHAITTAPVEMHPHHECFAYQVVFRHKSPEPTIVTVISVISQSKIHSLRNLDFQISRAGHTGIQDLMHSAINFFLDLYQP